MHIVPGLSCRDERGAPDVMRGEETQLIGAIGPAADSCLFVLPGTHSKWAVASDGHIRRFATFMTGELFGLLCRHNILGRLMEDGGDDAEAFRRGLGLAAQEAGGSGGLLNRLFSVRTLGWLESGDFADRQTSLNDHQVQLDVDGRMRIVLAQQDPGVPNWLDIEARPRGLLVYRWVWARSNPVPKAMVVALADVRGALPEAHPLVDAESRRRSLSRRREAAWQRFQ